MTTYELFIEPVGTTDRYEVDGSAASAQYETLVRLATGGRRGTVEVALVEVEDVDRATVLDLVDAVGDATWYRGTRGEAATGPVIAVTDLRRELAAYDRFELRYFEV